MSKKDISEINIIYDIKGKNNICLFGYEFVKNNKKCRMIIDNKEYFLSTKYNVKKNNDNKLKIKLKGIDSITNMSCMFLECSSLLSLPDISKWNTNNVTDIRYMFSRCHNLIISEKTKRKFKSQEFQ